MHIHDFESFDSRVTPFISLGLHYTFFNPKATTTYDNPNPAAYGDVFDRSNIYANWFENFPVGSGTYPINTDGGGTLSTVGSVGIRYKIDKLSDLMLDFRGQYFFSDWVDGLDHNWKNYDKNNDWLLWLSVGYIYYLD